MHVNETVLQAMSELKFVQGQHPEWLELQQRLDVLEEKIAKAYQRWELLEAE